MSPSKILLFFLISVFAFACTFAQRPHNLNMRIVIELSELDRYEMATWANDQDLHAQIVKKGEVEVRQWVLEGAPEQGEAGFGLSACAGIRSIRGGFGYFWFTCQAQFLETFTKEALALGYQQSNTGKLLNPDLQTNEGYDTYIYFSPPKPGKQSDSGIHIAVCNGWMELKCIP